MAETSREFEVVVVGAGPGGAACALTLARSGVSVIMLEKGKIPGERNVTGGVLYGGFTGHYGLVNLIPTFESEAPIERRITSHEVYTLSRPDEGSHSYRYYKLTKDSLASRFGLFNMDIETGHDYTVIRRKFDHWLAAKALEAGAMIATETTVHSLIMEDSNVVGVQTDKEDVRANVVVDCSGVTSTLVQEAGMRGRLTPRQLYQGVKRVRRLDSKTINQRFKVRDDEGKAQLYLGDFMKGVSGGAFIYNNKDTVSVGLVSSLDSVIRETTEHFDRVGKLVDVLDAFEEHPMVRELLNGSEVLEYSAHNIPKGHKSMLKKPYCGGFLVAGDALGAFVKIGPMIDGMRRAIASGIMAAETYIQARVSGSFGEKNLSRYRDLLSPIYEDVARSGRDSFLTESHFVYGVVPKVLFATRFLTTKAKYANPLEVDGRDVVQRIQEGTSLLSYDEDRDYSHIKVNAELASHSVTKPWIPGCPVNCYTLLTPKGVFASFKDLYQHNLESIKKDGKSGGTSASAYRETMNDIAEGKLRFDHIACVACGTCGAIGPEEMVKFTHEKSGHGVRFEYG